MGHYTRYVTVTLPAAVRWPAGFSERKRTKTTLKSFAAGRVCVKTRSRKPLCITMGFCCVRRNKPSSVEELYRVTSDVTPRRMSPRAPLVVVPRD